MLRYLNIDKSIIEIYVIGNDVPDAGNWLYSPNPLL
jgi:hypothetical protein